jgi:hypothetical protein
MLPLKAERFPTTSDDLSAAIKNSLLRWLDRPVVNLSGTYPAIDRLAIDASGSTADPRAGVPDIEPVGNLEPGPRIGSFQFTANPLRLRDVKASIETRATDASLAYGRNRGGEPLLVLQQVKEGRFSATIDRRELESAVLQAARAAAEPHGIAVQRVELALTAPDPHQLQIDATITAKKLVTAVVHVSGRASVDDGLNARLCNLRADADGVVGKLAAGLLRPHLQKLEGQQVSLLAFLPIHLPLHNLSVAISGPSLQFTANFGGSGHPKVTG